MKTYRYNTIEITTLNMTMCDEPIFHVTTAVNYRTLGFIHFNSVSQQFIFCPFLNVVFDVHSLKDIATFIETEIPYIQTS